MCRRQESDLRPRVYESLALPLSYADETCLPVGRNVAGVGIEPTSGDYEPPDPPLVHPAEMPRFPACRQVSENLGEIENKIMRL